jgi:hypothetical protein
MLIEETQLEGQYLELEERVKYFQSKMAVD